MGLSARGESTISSWLRASGRDPNRRRGCTRYTPWDGSQPRPDPGSATPPTLYEVLNCHYSNRVDGGIRTAFEGGARGAREAGLPEDPIWLHTGGRKGTTTYLSPPQDSEPGHPEYRPRRHHRRGGERVPPDCFGTLPQDHALRLKEEPPSCCQHGLGGIR